MSGASDFNTTMTATIATGVAVGAEHGAANSWQSDLFDIPNRSSASRSTCRATAMRTWPCLAALRSLPASMRLPLKRVSKFLCDVIEHFGQPSRSRSRLNRHIERKSISITKRRGYQNGQT
jgi:hypothetical protein